MSPFYQGEMSDLACRQAGGQRGFDVKIDLWITK